ncbi:SDR family oxidoreductase, partial [Pseudomonas aeruginosa]|nr:SDR family oxidoreductase [Pseudomonas aeruginosa]
YTGQRPEPGDDPDASAGQGRYRSRGRPGAEGEDWPGRLGEPLEIASAALFLASNESRRRYGTEILVDGGVRHLKKGAKARSW